MKVMITAGGTIEKIDPVRYISNFSSGKQGYAIAKVMSEVGFDVLLISANCNLADLNNVQTIKVTSAQEMLEACLSNLPADVGIFTAAVCDWKPEKISEIKLKKKQDEEYFNLKLIKNPDILKIISNHRYRPELVIGFAAETNNLIENAKIKLVEKKCDIIIANSVAESNSAFNSEYNEAYYILETEEEYWSRQTKMDLAKKLLNKIKLYFHLA